MRVGRPLKFQDIDKLKKAINAYFEGCYETQWFDIEERDEKGNIKFDKKGKVIYKHIKKYVRVKPVTVTGLAVALETSRQTLLEYEGEVPGKEDKDQEFIDAIKRAKDVIASIHETSMHDGSINPAVGIFIAKNNFGMKDQTDQVVRVNPKPIDDVFSYNSGKEDLQTKQES